MIANFNGLGALRFQDIEGIVAQEKFRAAVFISRLFTFVGPVCAGSRPCLIFLRIPGSLQRQRSEYRQRSPQGMINVYFTSSDRFLTPGYHSRPLSPLFFWSAPRTRILATANIRAVAVMV